MPWVDFWSLYLPVSGTGFSRMSILVLQEGLGLFHGQDGKDGEEIEKVKKKGKKEKKGGRFRFWAHFQGALLQRL